MHAPNNGSQIRRQPSLRPSFAGLRKDVRRPLTLDVIVQDEDGWEIPLESIDLSTRGMFVRSNFLFEAGDVHVLIFKSPAGDHLFRVRARVVRTETGRDYGDRIPADFVPGMAYEFISIEPAMRERLLEMVAAS
jgi:hypothetical protein